MSLKRTRYLLWVQGGILLLVLLMGMFLRYPSAHRGLFHYDEGQYLFSLQPAVLALRETLGLEAWPRPFQEPTSFDKLKAPYFAFTAKPGYDMLAIPYAILVGLVPSSLGLLSLLFGMGTIVVVYLLACSVFGDTVALAASATLAVSKFHVFYSGSQTTVAMCAFFMVSGLFLYFKALDKPTIPRLAIAGVTFAYAYGCHYNVLSYILMIFGFHAIRTIVFRQAGGLKGFLVMGVSFLGAIAVFEAFYRMLLPFAYSHLHDVRGSYFAQLHFAMGFFAWSSPSGVERFPSLLFDSEGVLVCALALAGVWHGAWTSLGSPKKALLLLLPITQLVFALVGGGMRSPVFSRMTVVMLPFIAIWAGAGVSYVAGMLTTRTSLGQKDFAAAMVLIVLILGLGTPRAWEIAKLRSGYPDSARYVLGNGEAQQVALGMPVEQYYLGSFEGVYGLPLSMTALRELYRRTGVRYLVLDHRTHILEEWGHPLGPVIRAFEQTHRPVTRIANPLGATLVAAAENAMSSQSLAQTLADPLSKEIRIYDIATLDEDERNPLASEGQAISHGQQASGTQQPLSANQTKREG